MIVKINKLLQTLAFFNFGFGVGTNICAMTVQVWPFVWGISIAKVESNLELRAGPITITVTYQKLP
jgi:hypothetical protein